MKKVSLMLLTIFISYCISAQVSKSIFSDKLNKQKFPYANKYRIFRLLHDNKLAMPRLLAKDTLLNMDNMPVAGQIPKPVFAGNNKHGFDIFTSPLDNMSIAKPDSTFISYMPSLKQQNKKAK